MLTHIVVGGLRFYRDSSSFRQLPSELAERNSTITGHMLGSECNLKIHVRNLMYTLPLQIGDPYFFRLFRNSTETLTAYIFGKKHDIHNQISALKSHGVSYIVSKFHELWLTNSLKLDRRFYPSSVNSALYFIARLRRRRSAYGTQPNFAKRWTVNRANNLP